MKKYFLFIALFSTLISCNDAKLDSAQPAPARIDSSTIAPVSAEPVKVDNNLGLGLTQEEIADDSIFSNGSIPTSWAIAGITDVKQCKLFLKQIQLLVLTDDKEQLAKAIRYPLGRSIKTEKNFIDQYDQLFTKEVKLSIANINFSQIFRNIKGVSTERGLVWFCQDGNEYKIIAINQ